MYKIILFFLVSAVAFTGYTIYKNLVAKDTNPGSVVVNNSEPQSSEENENVTLYIYLNSDASDGDLKQLDEYIRDLDEVVTVKKYSAIQALLTYRKANLRNSEAIEKMSSYENNPFDARVEIVLNQNDINKVEESIRYNDTSNIIESLSLVEKQI